MGSHPVNLALRFLLELSALFAMGVWGWGHGKGWLRSIPALGIPILAAVLWGTFAVPDDPSRSGEAPVAIPGVLRLAMELALFAFAVWALFESGSTGFGWVLGVLTAVHYVSSYDRILWLIRR